MPNWCSNDLVVQGPDVDVAHFMDAVHDKEHDEVFMFGAALPLPETDADTEALRLRVQASNNRLHQTVFDLFMQDGDAGRAAAMVLWGTQRDVAYSSIVRDEQVSDDHRLVVYRLDTAWSPPVDAIGGLSDLFPTLDLLLVSEEGGNQCFGADYFTAGKHAVDLGFESAPWALESKNSTLAEALDEALDYFEAGNTIPILVSSTRPEGADEMIADGLWTETFSDHDNGAVWFAEADTHAHMFTCLRENPARFEATYESFEQREHSPLEGFPDYLRSNGTLIEDCSDEQLGNLAQYLLADLFDAPVDASADRDIEKMTDTSSITHVLTFLLATDSHAASVSREDFVASYCAATRPLAV